MGVANAIIFCNIGAAYGTAKAAIGVGNLGLIAPTKIFKALVPIIMAGILGIYGLIAGVLISQKASPGLKEGDGYKYFFAGLTVGGSSLASGYAIGIAGEAWVKAYSQTEKSFVGMILVMIFAEAIGLYGLIIGLIIATS